MNKIPNLQTILGVLLVVWGIIWFQMMGPTNESSRVSLVNVSGPARMELMKQGELLTSLQKNVPQKSRTRESPFPAPINIFNLDRPEGPASEYSNQGQLEEEDRGAIHMDSFEDVHVTDASRFRFLGYLQLDDSTQAAQGIALVSTPDALHTVRSGETIEGQILIKGISPEEITIEDLSSHQEQQLPLRARGD